MSKEEEGRDTKLPETAHMSQSVSSRSETGDRADLSA